MRRTEQAQGLRLMKFEACLSACHIHPLGMGVGQHGHEWKPPYMWWLSALTG